MKAEDFYRDRMKEDETMGSVELMEEYAKYIIEQNFCNGNPIDFKELTIEQLKNTNDKINNLVDWVNE